MFRKNFPVDIGYPWNKVFTVTNEEDGSAVTLSGDTIRFTYGDTVLSVGSGITVAANQFTVTISDTSSIPTGPSVYYTLERSIGPNPPKRIMEGYLEGVV